MLMEDTEVKVRAAQPFLVDRQKFIKHAHSRASERASTLCAIRVQAKESTHKLYLLSGTVCILLF